MVILQETETILLCLAAVFRPPSVVRQVQAVIRRVWVLPVIATMVSHSNSSVIPTKMCKTFHHHKCKTSSIQKKCSRYKAAKLKSVLAEMKSLIVKYNRLKQESSVSKKEIDKLNENYKKDIKVFHKELNTIFDNRERNVLPGSDKWKLEENRRVDQDMSTIVAAENVLKVDCKRSEDAIKSDKKEVSRLVGKPTM